MTAEQEDRAFLEMLAARRFARENACAVCGQLVDGRQAMRNASGKLAHAHCLAPRTPGPDAPGMAGCR